jgi:hypothetical protein
MPIDKARVTTDLFEDDIAFQGCCSLTKNMNGKERSEVNENGGLKKEEIF